MACVTFKRSLEYEPMLNNSVRPCKRARFNSGPGCQSLSPPPDQLHPQTPKRISPQPGISSPFGDVSNKLTPEKMAANIKEEAHRLSRKKHLRFPSPQTFTGFSVAMDNQSSMATENNEFHVDAGQKRMFTLSQVGYLCQRMMDEQKQRICEEYENVLRDKLAEQYDTFVRFDHDQLQKKLVIQSHPSYLS